MPRTAETIAQELNAGGARAIMYLDGTFGGIILYRASSDPRVVIKVQTPKKGAAKTTFHFGDDAVEVEVSGTGPIIRDEGRVFETFDDLCEAIATHERVLAAELEWSAAAPTEEARP